MKNSFNFLQFANWLIVCRENIQKICDEVVNEQITKEEALKKLYIEKRRIYVLKKVLDRGANLHGIRPDFLRKLKDIKKQYGIEE
jgi:hypothetical protein